MVLITHDELFGSCETGTCVPASLDAALLLLGLLAPLRPHGLRTGALGIPEGLRLGVVRLLRRGRHEGGVSENFPELRKIFVDLLDPLKKRLEVDLGALAQPVLLSLFVQGISPELDTTYVAVSPHY